MLAGRLGADDVLVGAGGEPAMTGACGQENAVACDKFEFAAIAAAEEHTSLAAGNA